MRFHQRPAQSMLELILAIGIILTSTISATALIITTITAGRSSQTKIEAANLAREGVEIIRAIRDSNWLKKSQNVIVSGTTIYDWDTGISVAGDYIAEFNSTTNSWTLRSYNADLAVVSKPNSADYYTQNCQNNCTKTRYSRRINLSFPADDQFFSVGDAPYINVTSTVTWQDHGAKTYSATEKLYNWR